MARVTPAHLGQSNLRRPDPTSARNLRKCKPKRLGKRHSAEEMKEIHAREVALTEGEVLGEPHVAEDTLTKRGPKAVRINGTDRTLHWGSEPMMFRSVL